MIKKTSSVLGLIGLLALAAGCSGGGSAASEESGSPDTSGSPAGPALTKVLFLGDSVAAGQALPMAAAFEESGVGFESMASDGGGNVVGPAADRQWKELPDQIASAAADVVVYQITTYDWGTREEQRAGYEKLVSTVAGNDADLVFVTMPPIKPDDFYKPHMDELERTEEVARGVAESSKNADLLDAQQVWGDSYKQTRDGKPDRSTDGIHTCPQGAARFTQWLLSELSESYSFTPAPAKEWANAGWSADERFKGC